MISTVRELMALRHQRVAFEEDRREKLSRLLHCGLRRGRLPLLSELPDQILGPTPTVYTEQGRAPYVVREADAWLADALARRERGPFPFVVLTGVSMAGKSRTALEAARKVFGDVPVVVAHNGQALAELMRLDPQLLAGPPPVLVWLDNLRVGDLDHLTVDVLDELADCATILATMTIQHWNEIRYAGSEITTVSRYALQRATSFQLSLELTQSEKDQGRRLYPDKEREFSADVASIGEVLVGGEHLLAKYDAGREENPAGYALMQAAIDWRRCGLTRPIPKDAFDRLFPLYLNKIRIDLPPTPEHFGRGLAWAIKPFVSQVALLWRSATSKDIDATWDVLDYVVAADDGQGRHPSRPIPTEIWYELLNIVDAHEGLEIGMTAHLRGLPLEALAAFRKAAESGHPDYESAGYFNLGVLLAEADDFAGACAAFNVAIDSGHSIDAPAAAVGLGILLAKHGDIAGARATFQIAIDSSHLVEADRAKKQLDLLT